jgi:hypothetical protein
MAKYSSRFSSTSAKVTSVYSSTASSINYHVPQDLLENPANPALSATPTGYREKNEAKSPRQLRREEQGACEAVSAYI